MTDETEPAGAGAWDDGVPAADITRSDYVKWPSPEASELVRRTAAGEALRTICRDPHMPSPRSVERSMRKRPAFRAAIEAARAEWGRSFAGRKSSYCRETAEIIFQRLCAGQGLTRICEEDPTLPASATIYRWLAEIEEFRQAVGLAREIAAEGFFEKGWELADAATPETAYATDVKLKHLRWHAGKLSPRKYGAVKPVEPPPPLDQDDRNNLIVVVKNFVYGTEEEDNADSPERVLYTMKRLPQTPAAKRDADQARAEARLEARQKFQREKEAELAELIRRRQAGEAAAPETPEDPEGWR